MRAAIYTRISSDDGTALGVARQEEDCRTLANRRGWPVVGVYADNDISASSGKPRPAYQRLLADIEDGLVNAVIVWDLDRLHRRPIELEQFLDLADRRHVALASIGGDVDLATPQGRMVARIKGAVARQEADQIGRRVRRKFDQLANAGKPSNGGKRPYGYTTDRMHLIESEAAIIREIAARLLAGESLHEIARDLNTRHIPTVQGGPWTTHSIRTILRAPRMAGLRQHRGTVIGSAAWPPILDRATWEGIGALLRDPNRRAPGHAHARHHLLSGIARCDVCMGPLHVQHRGNSRSTAYACRRRGCGKVFVRVPELDKFVLRLLFRRLHERGIGPAATDDGRALAEEIAAAEARRDLIAIEFANDPDMDPAMVRAMAHQMKAKLDSLYACQAQQRRADALAGLDPAKVPELWDDFTMARKRFIIREALGPILVKPAAKPGSHVFDPDRVDVPDPAERDGVTA